MGSWWTHVPAPSSPRGQLRAVWPHRFGGPWWAERQLPTAGPAHCGPGTGSLTSPPFLMRFLGSPPT